MANVEELLRKQKDRIEKIDASPAPRKKIVRTGPTRPWQENLPKYQSSKSSITQKLKPTAGGLPAPKEAEEVLKVEPNLGQKLSQSEAKVEPNLGQKLSQSEAKVEPNPVLGSSKLEPKVEPYLSQSEAKVEPKHQLLRLIGLQRKVLLFIYESCRIEGSKISAPINISNMASISEAPVSATRKATQRVERKGYISRIEYKDGRGGWTRYSIPDATYNALLLEETRAKVEPKLSQTRAKVGTQPEPNSPSSSSISVSENLKTTTTSDQQNLSDVSLGFEWGTVVCDALASIGFSQTHLKQIASSGKLTPTEIQDSIDAFAFDLKRNGKAAEIKGSPLNYFMGILRRGMPYAAPENFETPEAEARRKYLEGKRRLQELRENQARELEEIEFTEWRQNLGREEIDAIVPEVVRRVPKAEEASLKSHFQENVWPALRTSTSGTFELEREKIRQEIERSLGEAKS